MTKKVWRPGLEAEQSIRQYTKDLLSALPRKLGTPELIPGCEVMDLDPFATGTLPRDITVRINEYYQFVTYRGSPALAVGDLVLVAHLREADLYEIVGISGSGGSSPPTSLYLSVWVYDVSLGLLLQYTTINLALAYALLAAGDYVLIGPGTYDEAITLVNGVIITEMVPGTVIINLTTANDAVTTVGGGYLQVKEVRVTRANNNIRSVASLHNAGDCTIIAELIRSVNGGTGGCYGVEQDATGNLFVFANDIQASGGDFETIGVNCEQGTQIVYGKLLAENGTGSFSIGALVDGATANQTIYGDCLATDDDFLYGVVCAGAGTQTIRGHCTGTTVAAGGEGYGAWCVQAGCVQTVYGDVTGVSPAVAVGAHCTNGTQTILYGRASGATADLRRAGGTLQAFAVQHDTVAGTITWLDGTSLQSLREYVQGNIIRGGAADWETYPADTDHFILVGDGTDVVSAPFDWDDMAAGAGADMAHDHTTALEGDATKAEVLVWIGW